MANNKITLEEKKGDGLQVTGVLCGYLPGILQFTEASIQAIMEETYNAATAQEPKPEFDREAVGVFCAIRVMKNAFNEFVEDHIRAFDAATELDNDFEKMLEKEKGAM